MSTISQPFGLRPSYSPSGVVRPTAYTIATGYGTNILQNQPVKIGTDGTVQAAAIGDRSIGTFQGVEFTDSDIGGLVIAGLMQEKILAAYALNNPEVLRLEPPAVITEEQVERVIAGLGAAVAHAVELLGMLED